MAYMRLHREQADGHLPMVCMACGDPAVVVKAKKMSWFPRWVFWLLLLHVLIFLIVAAIMHKRATIQAPFCERCRWHWGIRQAYVLGSLLALLLMIGGTITFFSQANVRLSEDLVVLMILGGSVVVVGWLISVVIVQNTAIRPAEITKTHILVAGVSDAFIQAVEEAEIERRVRLRQMEEEDAQEADYPATRRRPVDTYEEEAPPRSAPPPDAFKE